MLTQKMTKELLLIANGIDVDANKVNIKKTAELFEKTLNDLITKCKKADSANIPLLKNMNKAVKMYEASVR